MIHDPAPRIAKIGDALSQLANVALSWDHTETTSNESISGKAYRLNKKSRKWINALFFWQEDHCRMAFENDLIRARQTLADFEERASRAINSQPLSK